MLSQEIAFIEKLFDGLKGDVSAAHETAATEFSNVHQRLDRAIEAVRDETQALHARLDKTQTALVALAHLIAKGFNMSALTDAVRTEIAELSTDFGQMFAQRQQSDDAGVTDIKSDLDALKTKVANYLASASNGAGTSAPGTGDQGAAPTAPVVGPTSTSVTNADGSTTVVQHADGSAATTDASGASVPTDPAAVQTAASAAAAQGISIPTP